MCSRQVKRALFPVVAVLMAWACSDSSDERLERLEQRVQASEFQLAGFAELEPRVMKELEAKSQVIARQNNELANNGERLGQAEREVENYAKRLEMVEQWIQEKDKEEEQQKLFAWDDGVIPDPWKQLETACQMTRLGEAQTVLNWMVRINSYMSDFPVQHAVDLSSNDPLVFVTAPMAEKSASMLAAYKDMELDILKSRDQWLGYRIDRSWQTRPELGMCRSACCTVNDAGRWKCEWSGYYDRWGSPGTKGRWECEYDAEGWRDYKARWWRRCDYVAGTRDFRSMPYLMKRVQDNKVTVSDPLYCVVDIIWENRIYCLSHSQYPVMQIRMEEGTPEEPVLHPNYPRFTLLAISNWDVIYKDEFSQMWVVQGTEKPNFPGQLSGFKVEPVQVPTCSVAPNPEGVVKLTQDWLCTDPMARESEMPALLAKHGFKDRLDFEIQKAWVTQDAKWSSDLNSVTKQGCPQ